MAAFCLCSLSPCALPTVLCHVCLLTLGGISPIRLPLLPQVLTLKRLSFFIISCECVCMLGSTGCSDISIEFKAERGSVYDTRKKKWVRSVSESVTHMHSDRSPRVCKLRALFWDSSCAFALCSYSFLANDICIGFL